MLMLVVGAALLAGVVVALAATRTKVPLTIGFLGLGMLLGSEGPGGIAFDDPELARTVGIAALAAILFEGGLTTAWRDMRSVVVPASLLATLGVAITAGITGLAAYLLFDVSLTTALLIGAIVGSTDAAAVFLTLRGTSLRRRPAALLEVESGLNDPMAVALTIGLISFLTVSDYGSGDFVVFLLQQLGLGAVVGLLAGAVAAWGITRVPASMSAFASVASVGLAALSFGAADVIGGSGFLAIYLVGLRLGNTPNAFRGALAAFHQGLAYISQIALFVVLGLLVFPSELGAVAVPGLILAGVLILLARPLAVVLTLVGQRFGAREQALISWAGLRGAVPIVLATFPPTEGVADSDTIFNAVFFVVIASALIQGPTLEPLARRLRLTTDEGPLYRPPLEVGAVEGADLVEYLVGPRDAIAGRRVRELELPRTALVAVVVRRTEAIPPRGRTVVEAGDRLYVMVRAPARAELERLFDRWEHGPLAPSPEPAPDEAAGAEAALPDRDPVTQRHSLALAGGPPLLVEVRPDGAVTLAGSGSDGPRVTLRLDQARALAEELIGGGSGSATRAGDMRRTALPGVGERLRIEGADGILIVILNRWEGVCELILGDGEPERVAVLADDERRRLGAMILAATLSGASG